MKQKISKKIKDDIKVYASCLRDIFGEKSSAIERALADDIDDEKIVRTINRLPKEDRDHVRWIVGWFRGAADALSTDPVTLFKGG